MHSGRSRAILFAHMVGAEGEVLVVEPDSASHKLFSSLFNKGTYRQVKVEKGGAWNSNTTLSFFVDPKHPATNFTGDARTYSEDVMKKYKRVDVSVDTVDSIVDRHCISETKLVSITTNGAEENILEGMRETLKSTQYICLARTGDGYHDLMERYGFQLYAYDDRGFTYKNNDKSR